MTPRGALGPFQPGPGGMPPYLAGRDPEQRLLTALLERLRDNRPPPSEVLLCGPRGNGKTVLLTWLEQEAAREPRVETVVLLPSEIPDRRQLAEQLAPRAWWNRLTPEEVEVFGISWRPGHEGRPSLTGLLEARARKNPLLLLIDEAHTLEVAVGRTLLQASQRVGRRLPFLLVLAGTPDLQSHLDTMGVSFWSRARQLRIGRLDEAATAEALRRPFAEARLPLREEALKRLVRESQGYPFFIQLLGEAAWAQAVAGTSAVSPAAVEAARAEFEETKGEYYLERLDELRKGQILPVGRAVAEAFKGRSVLSDRELGRAIADGLGGATEADALERVTETLRNLGYIWRVKARPEWEPGIPSLMDYIRRFAPAE